jgi:hypothetical protein
MLLWKPLTARMARLSAGYVLNIDDPSYSPLIVGSPSSVGTSAGPQLSNRFAPNDSTTATQSDHIQESSNLFRFIAQPQSEQNGKDHGRYSFGMSQYDVRVACDNCRVKRVPVSPLVNSFPDPPDSNLTFS